MVEHFNISEKMVRQFLIILEHKEDMCKTSTRISDC